MSRVPMIVPLLALTILLVAISQMPGSRVLVVGFGTILIAGGLWLRHLLRRHDRGRDTN
jgi:hypothetical protein